MRSSDWSSDVCSSDLALPHTPSPPPSSPPAAEFLVGTLLAFLVLVLRMPSALVEPALWPDDLNYLIHVYEVPGAPVWHYVNMAGVKGYIRSEEHTSELQSLMRISYAVFCLKKKTTNHVNKKIIMTNNIIS